MKAQWHFFLTVLLLIEPSLYSNTVNEEMAVYYKVLFSDYPSLEERVCDCREDFWIDSYLSENFRALSKEQLDQCLALTRNPKWGSKNMPPEVYYQLHQETALDHLLRFTACYLTKVIIHGNLNQEELSLHLEKFDIQRLMDKGPYQSPVLSLNAQKLIYDSLQGVNKVYDIHLHNLGYDEGNFLNPQSSVRGLANWVDYFTFTVLRYASGMSNPLGSTHEARKRIHLYAAHFPKLSGFILPIHKAIFPDGRIDWEKTGNYLSNFSARLTATSFTANSSKLYTAVSIHPFDLNWEEKLQKAHQRGILLVKWMPPQSIPPDSEKLDAFYLKMKELGMTLIAHTGPEHTIPTPEDYRDWQDWGNPLRFRRALQNGVNVIFAHCGHNDLIPDLDDPNRPLVSGQLLFFRIAREAHQKNLTGEWQGKVYGDLAAVTTHYGANFIKELLMYAREEGIRLIYGSDYPYTNLIKPNSDAYEICSEAGLLERSKVNSLKEIRNWNPLLANYVFTRNLEVVIENGLKLNFPECTFTGEFEDGELILWQD